MDGEGLLTCNVASFTGLTALLLLKIYLHYLCQLHYRPDSNSNQINRVIYLLKI